MTYIETIWQDILYAVRMMRKNSAFAIAAVLTLALGIGANAAIFSVIRAVLLKPLGYRDSDRLVRVSVDHLRRNQQDGPFSLVQFEEMNAGARSFAGVGAYGPPENLTISGSGEPEVLKGARVSANFLDVLGVQPILGRGFLPEEDRPGGPMVAMISDALWQRRFGGDPTVGGKTATIDSTPRTIVGVLPAGFAFPFAGVDVWVPRPSEWSRLPPRVWRTTTVLTGFARLKPNFSIQQATAELEVLNRQYAAEQLDNPENIDSSMRVVWMKDQLVANVRPLLWMLFGAVGFVLLIACGNVAGLLLARSTSRSREFAVRAAIGASRGRLIRQLLAESVVLSVAGGTLGLFLAHWGLLAAMTGIGSLTADNWSGTPLLPRSGEVRLDAWVLGFSIAVSILTAVLFGLLPSIQVSRPDLAAVLRESGAGAGRTASGRRRFLGVGSRGLLVIGQVALSVVLLIGAALLIESFARLRNVDTGFRTTNLLTMKVPLQLTRYDTDPKRVAFYAELVRRVASVPGVRAATVAWSLPTTPWFRTTIEVEGQPPQRPGVPPPSLQVQSVTPGYFQTLGIPIRRGRDFDARDNTIDAPPVTIINERMARRYWPDYPRGRDPVGQHILLHLGSEKRLEIVGVAADVHEGGLSYEAGSEFYIPSGLHPPQTAYLVARTDNDPLGSVNSIRSQVLAIDQDQPVSEVKTMEAVLEASVGGRRLTMLLLGMFAGAALLLAMVGIYGVIAYSVGQRTQEVGIRRALGAQQSQIMRLILAEGMLLVLVGVTIGIGGAFALTRVIKSLLFHVSATEPVTFAGIALLFVCVALVACLLPAQRAARIDPMVAMRT